MRSPAIVAGLGIVGLANAVTLVGVGVFVATFLVRREA
jgi:hypothetical protein